MNIQHFTNPTSLLDEVRDFLLNLAQQQENTPQVEARIYQCLVNVLSMATSDEGLPVVYVFEHDPFTDTLTGNEYDSWTELQDILEHIYASTHPQHPREHEVVKEQGTPQCLECGWVWDYSIIIPGTNYTLGQAVYHLLPIVLDSIPPQNTCFSLVVDVAPLEI